MGDPMRPLMWVSKSHDEAGDDLARWATTMSPNSSRASCWSTSSNTRARSIARPSKAANHPDRNAQFEHINAQVMATQAAGQPVISVDTKKKELIGDFKNGGTRLSAEGLSRSKSTCMTSWTRSLARSFLWRLRHHGQCRLGQRRHHSRHRGVRGQFDPPLAGADGPRALSRMRELMITADGGGSNGSRCAAVEGRTAEAGRRDWAADQGLPLSAGHVQVEQDRASTVLPHHAELARPTAHQSRGRRRTDRRNHDQDRPEGRCELDTRTYPKGIKVSDAEMEALNIKGDTFHPEWNYTVHPRPKNCNSYFCQVP